MKTFWAYEAFDGKVFYNEDECRDYEHDLRERTLLKNVKFYDSNNNLFNLEKLYDINDILYDIHKIVIPSKEDCDMLNEWLEDYCTYDDDIYFSHEGTWYLLPVVTTDIKIVSEENMIE